MARIYGLNGVLRGRQGNNVFSVLNGTQVVKSYQPVVANPRSIGQREQRAKFALAGKFSSATPTDALIGMRGGNPRERRAAFVANLVRNATTRLSGSTVIAAVPFESVKFAEGALGVYSYVPSVTAQWSGSAARENVRVTVSAISLPNIVPEGYGERIVVALFDPVTYALDQLETAVRTNTAADFYFRVGERRDVVVAAYVVPFVADDSVRSYSASNMYSVDNSVELQGLLSSGAASLTFGESVFVNAVALPAVNAQTSTSREGDESSEVATKAKPAKKM